MGVQVETQIASYIIHDVRCVPREDSVYEAATGLAGDVMEGIWKISHSHTLMAATLFITDDGAKLIILTRSFEVGPIDAMLDSILKRVSYDPASGNLYTYEIPILELSSDNELDAL